MTGKEQPFELKTVALAAFGPTLLFATGEGAILPMIPLVAADLAPHPGPAPFLGAWRFTESP